MVLGINNGDSVKAVQKFFEKYKATFQPVRQKSGEISKAYGVHAYPTNYIIGPDGKIAGRWVGFEEKEIKATLDKLAPAK